MSELDLEAYRKANDQLVQNAADELSDPFLTQQEAAVYLRTSVSTLRRWRSHDRGPKHIRISGRVRYKLSELRNFIEDCAASSDAGGSDE